MGELYEWNPWKNTETNKNLMPEIDEPPCKHCEFWKPQTVFLSNGKYDRVVCCLSDEMFKDFSCFSPNPEKIINNNEIKE